VIEATRPNCDQLPYLRKSSGLTQAQCLELAALARRRYGKTALGPYVVWDVSLRRWRATVFIVVKGRYTEITRLGPFADVLSAVRSLRKHLGE